MIKKRIFLFFIVMVISLFNYNSGLAAFKYGDNGPEVIVIQNRLSELNYDVGEIDGILGKTTESAIKRFQANNNLTVDGIVGSDTYKALFNERILFNEELPDGRNSRTIKIRTVLYAAYECLGIPYVFGGTDKNGFDCSGFTKYAFAEAGIWIPRLADDQFDFGKEVSLDQLRIGDLVFFETYEPGASHCGIYVGNGEFIHAGSSTGIAVARVLDNYWGARYYGACRIF